MSFFATRAIQSISHNAPTLDSISSKLESLAERESVGGHGTGFAGIAKSAVVLAAKFGALAAVMTSAAAASGMMGRGVLNMQKHLIAYNTQIGVAFAKLERGDIMRNISLGQKTSGSSELLAETINRFSDETADLKAAMVNARNLFGVGMAELGRQTLVALKHIPFIGRKLHELIEWLNEDPDKKGQHGTVMYDFLKKVADGEYSGFRRDRKTKMSEHPRWRDL